MWKLKPHCSVVTISGHQFCEVNAEHFITREHIHTKLSRQFKFGDEISITKVTPLFPLFDFFMCTDKFVICKKGLMEEEDNIIVKWAQEDVETSYNLLNNNKNLSRCK